MKLGLAMKPGLAAAALAAFAAFAGGSANAATMLCSPNQAVATIYPTGTTYTAAADGIVTGVSVVDVVQMAGAGCIPLAGGGGIQLVARLIGANFNATTDQTIPLLLPPGAVWSPTSLSVRNCSVSLTTAAGSIYSAASKGGTTIFGTGGAQAMTDCTGAAQSQVIAATAAGAKLTIATAPILSLTTGQGAAATGDVYVYGYVGE
jgi:hypothetical protein